MLQQAPDFNIAVRQMQDLGETPTSRNTDWPSARMTMHVTRAREHFPDTTAAEAPVHMVAKYLQSFTESTAYLKNFN